MDPDEEFRAPKETSVENDKSGLNIRQRHHRSDRRGQLDASISPKHNPSTSSYLRTRPASRQTISDSSEEDLERHHAWHQPADRSNNGGCRKPRKWSVSSILLLTLAVASLSSLLINTATVFVVTKTPNTAHEHLLNDVSDPETTRSSSSTNRVRRVKDLLVRGKKTGSGRATGVPARVVYLEDMGKTMKDNWQAKQGRFIATMFPVEIIVRNASVSNSMNSSSDATLEMNMTNPDIIPKDEITNSSNVDSLAYLDRCIPKATWQTATFVNCNAFHELDIPGSSVDSKHGVHSRQQPHEEQLTVLGEGWFRTAWKLDARNQTTVLKTLRIEREFLAEYYELHRRDAVAMERLTWSPFVVNVFGYCGNSAINEIADFPYREVNDLEHFDRKMRYRENVPQVRRIKLQMAASIAQGVADIHSIDGPEVGATMVHYDLNPRNIAIFRHGRPKINDLNIAEFLRYDPTTNRTCGFPNRMKQPWWRAPEEVNVTSNVEINEKVDIYSLGAILFHIFTTHSPRGKMKAERMEAVRADVVRGVPPTLPPPYNNMTDPVSMAFKRAMERCFVADPNERASADEIVEILFDALVQLLGDQKKKISSTEAKQTQNKMASRAGSLRNQLYLSNYNQTTVSEQ